MIIIDKNKNIEERVSVKIENFGKSPLLSSFKSDVNIKELIDFLQQLDYDIRSQCSLSFFSNDKILILRS